MNEVTKNKKPFYKRWWFITLVVLIILGGIGSTIEDEEESADGEKITTSAPSTDTKAAESKPKVEKPKKEDKPKKEPAKENAKIGTPINVGKATFTVTGTKTADQVGPSVLPSKASGKYLIVEVTYKNNGNEAVTMDSSFFKLKRGEKTYEADSMASMSANQSEDGNIENSFFLQQVNPDMEISGKVVYDLAPEVAEATDLQLQVQTGFFGTETGIIDLK